LLACFLIRKQVMCSKCKCPFTAKVTKISLRLKETHIHSCTVEGAAQTNLSDVLPFWIREDDDAEV